MLFFVPVHLLLPFLPLLHSLTLLYSKWYGVGLTSYPVIKYQLGFSALLLADIHRHKQTILELNVTISFLYRRTEQESSTLETEIQPLLVLTYFPENTTTDNVIFRFKAAISMSKDFCK